MVELLEGDVDADLGAGGHHLLLAVGPGDGGALLPPRHLAHRPAHRAAHCPRHHHVRLHLHLRDVRLRAVLVKYLMIEKNILMLAKNIYNYLLSNGITMKVK